jgi:hypothetical protein
MIELQNSTTIIGQIYDHGYGIQSAPFPFIPKKFQIKFRLKFGHAWMQYI